MSPQPISCILFKLQPSLQKYKGVGWLDFLIRKSMGSKSRGDRPIEIISLCSVWYFQYISIGMFQWAIKLTKAKERTARPFDLWHENQFNFISCFENKPFGLLEFKIFIMKWNDFTILYCDEPWFCPSGID